jgi:hypothetical protein
MEVSGETCSCCGCNGRNINVGISFSWQAGLGIADEFTVGGYKVGYDILGPQIGDGLELHYAKECGEDGGGIRIDQTASASRRREIGGGIGVVGLSGAYTVRYYIQWGAEANSVGADAYVILGYDVVAKYGVSYGAGVITGNYSFTHYYHDSSKVYYSTPKLMW